MNNQDHEVLEFERLLTEARKKLPKGIEDCREWLEDVYELPFT